jgi:hypothetical protein
MKFYATATALVSALALAVSASNVVDLTPDNFDEVSAIPLSSTAADYVSAYRQGQACFGRIVSVTVQNLEMC